MKKLIVLAFLVLCLTGCHRGDLKVSLVIKGQPAPHAGYCVGPELWVEPGMPCPVTGAVINIEGTDPNSIFGE